MRTFMASVMWLVEYLYTFVYQFFFRLDSLGEQGGGLESMVRNLRENEKIDRACSIARIRLRRVK
jgi:hypothetical protein